MRTFYSTLCLILFVSSNLYGQTKQISLQETMRIAADSSIQALKAHKERLEAKFRYQNFKNFHLPNVNLQATPVSYNQVFVKRYDSEQNIDIYRPQQSLNSNGNLSIQQNIGLTGGQFFINSDLGYLKNFGVSTYEQFSSVPLRIGYSQKLFGFNQYKWDKQIEPIRYSRVEKEYLQKIEESNKLATGIFFDLAYAQEMYKLSKQNLDNVNNLYNIGLNQVKVGSISKNELLLLKLETLNYKRLHDNAKLNLEHAKSSLCNYLRIKYDSITTILPNEPPLIKINIKDAVNKALKNNPIADKINEELLIAERRLDIAKKSNRFSANISASVGFNQVASSLQDAYKNPTRQDMARISINIPILDWGSNKSKIVVATEDLDIAKITSKQKMQTFISEINLCVHKLNTYQEHIKIAKQALIIAEQSYHSSKQMFLVGKIDVNKLNVSISKQIEAKSNYIQIIKNYWTTYYQLRKLTLFDFVNNSNILH